MNEKSGNQGYIAFKRESAPGTVADTPDIFVPMYEEDLSTDYNSESEMSAFGSKAARLHVTPGIRSHTGNLVIMAEPNTSMMVFDMLLTRGNVSGGGPYTWPFTASHTNPASYTIDISAGDQVFRYAGVQASQISPSWTNNEMRWNIAVSALKSFRGAEIASFDTATITLNTTNNPKPTELLVAGDVVRIWYAGTDTTEDATIDSVTDTTVVLTGTPSGTPASGDMLMLKPLTVSLNIAEPFLWSRTEFRFASSASSALSATHTPVEDGSEWSILHPFNDDAGEKSSGSFDPSRLVRSRSVDGTVRLRKFFENPSEIKDFNGLKKIALVIRCFSGTNHELRITFNNLRPTGPGGSKPMVRTEEAEFHEIDYLPTYDTSDGAMLGVTVINGIAS